MDFQQYLLALQARRKVFLLVFAAIRNTAALVSTPAGYTYIQSLGNATLFAKIHTGSEVAPTVAFTVDAASPSANR